MTDSVTLCAGRFTLHLPPPASGGFSQASFNDLRLRWQTGDAAAGGASWQAHLDDLRRQAGQQFGKTRIVKEYTLAGRRAVFYQYAPSADSPFTLETWTAYGGNVLVSEFDGRRADLPAIEQLTFHVLEHFLPAGPGQRVGSAFCLPGGAIDLPPEQGEQADGSWQFGAHRYEIAFRSAVVTAPGTIDLVQRARAAQAQSQTTPGSHLVVERARDRAVLGMNGQETLVHFHNDPSPDEVYTAEFAFGGIKDRGSKPELHLKMSAHDEPGHKIDPRDFAAAWELILQTLEVRLKD